MPDNGGSSGNVLLGVLVGAILVGVAVFFSMGDFGDGARQGDSVTIELPDVEVGNEKTN
jgi:hypothetical protein